MSYLISQHSNSIWMKGYLSASVHILVKDIKALSSALVLQPSLMLFLILSFLSLSVIFLIFHDTENVK